MESIYTRTEGLLGKDAIEILKSSHVIVFGLGGVGGHAAEALCRSGIGTLTLVDFDSYTLSNCNRQAFATSQTVGMKKTDAALHRLKEINPSCVIRTFPMLYTEETHTDSLFEQVDYILDAIDNVWAKMQLIKYAHEKKIPIISSMGTGNKLDPTAFRVADIDKTKTCPLARIIRKECKKLGISRLKVVYSEEEPKKGIIDPNTGKNIPASVSFVPGVVGMILAGEIIKDMVKECL